MNSIDQVKALIDKLKAESVPLQEVAWQTALACVGYPYVFGAWGEECRPAKRAQFGTSHYLDHKTIVTKCKAISWDSSTKSCKVTGNCSGCQWNLPVMMFDCRGFTYKMLLMVYGFKLQGAGATSQWNTAANWKAKGTIDSMPKDTLCCLFVKNGSTMEHTGFGYNNETVECSSGVQHFTTRNKKWTNWAVPACVEGEEPVIDEGYAIVTGKRVALRKEPSKSASIIMRIDTGETVKLEEPPPCEWDYVEYKGKKGWMMKEFLREG